MQLLAIDKANKQESKSVERQQVHRQGGKRRRENGKRKTNPQGECFSSFSQTSEFFVAKKLSVSVSTLGASTVMCADENQISWRLKLVAHAAARISLRKSEACRHCNNAVKGRLAFSSNCCHSRRQLLVLHCCNWAARSIGEYEEEEEEDVTLWLGSTLGKRGSQNERSNNFSLLQRRQYQ